jgi:nicotinate-nucleotide adenylyltransferase
VVEAKTKFHVYFGGTFDPPHKGHMQMLAALVKDDWAEKIFLVPTSKNPLKSLSTEIAGFASIEERRQIIKLWMDHCKKTMPLSEFEKIVLREDEILSEQSSYTVDTLEVLKKESSSDSKWVLCVGSDSLEHLDKWKNIEKLLSGVEGVWIFIRSKDTNVFQKIPTALRSWCDWRIFPDEINSVSSSDIRKTLMQQIAEGNFDFKVDGMIDSLNDAIRLKWEKRLKL